MDRPALVDLDLVALVDGLAEQVEDAPERHVADRHGDRAAGVDDLHAAGEAVGGVHGDRAHAVVAEVLLDLADQPRAGAGADALLLLGVVALALDDEREVDLGQRVGEHGLDHDALDLLDPPDVALARVAPVGAVGGLCGGAGFHWVLSGCSS